MHGHGHSKKASAAMGIVAIGLIYGDIGTSPLYVMKAVLESSGGMASMSREFVLGVLSMIFWTITLLTTVKYVMIAMRANNNGEGSVFSVYTLVKKCGKYLVIPAMVGGAALLADCVLMPAVTVTTAVEGMRSIPMLDRLLGEGHLAVMVITTVIITAIFLLQRTGSREFEHLMGPIMIVWFLFLAAQGLYGISGMPDVLRAFNPMWAVRLIFGPYNSAGLAIFGAVFLANTGAEALYSDMGHVGRPNVLISWPFVKLCLLLNYLGQGAWLIKSAADPAYLHLEGMNPFFEMLPPMLRPVAVIMALFAAVVASSSIITGSYNLICEAINLDFMPHMKIQYPFDTKGQPYIEFINKTSLIGCIIMVLVFETSGNMEATHGLTNIVNMLATTVLLGVYAYRIKKRKALGVLLVAFFGSIELVFCVSLFGKFMHGGYFAMALAFLYFTIMFIWERGTVIEKRQSAKLHIDQYLYAINMLRRDDEVVRCADNLVFFTNNDDPDLIDRDIIYSILDGEPKRAGTYWIVNVKVHDRPYHMTYSVESYGTDYIFFLQLNLGFKVVQCVSNYIEQVADDLIESGELPYQDKKYFIMGLSNGVYGYSGGIGNFKYCMIHKSIRHGTELSPFSTVLLQAKYSIRHAIGSQVQWYDLDENAVIEETIPLFIPARRQVYLKRVDFPKKGVDSEQANATIK